MRYLTLPNLTLPASRLAIGVDLASADENSAPLLDWFFEHGGNVFDTARIYDGGRSEQVLGKWLARRGVRQNALVISKGAHTPDCHPEALTAQLEQSLRALELDALDIYLMHRDNLEVPVDEFVDVLNQHFRAGKMRLFGVSNWSRERLEAANAYAEQRGLEPLRVLSNQLSLARMVRAPWPGCTASWEPEERAYLRARQLPLIAWSAGARGFFARGGRAPDASDEARLAWESPDNHERRRRAETLAHERGVTPTAVSLAYVLGQAFPTLAVIGPKTCRHLEQSFESLALELSPADMSWLDLSEATRA